MDLKITILSEINQREEHKCYMILLICGILKKGTNEHIHQTESQMQKTNLRLPGDKARGRDKLGDWDGHKHTTTDTKE